MTSQVPVVHVEICIPLAATERTFLQLAVQAAAKKFREIRSESSGCAEPTYTEPIRICRLAD